MMIETNEAKDVQVYQEAASFFRAAASEHIPQACHYLALMYEYGLGIDQDFNAAIKFYTQAAELHYPEAMYNLAMMYAYGRGVPQDFRQAMPWLESAARYTTHYQKPVLCSHY